MTKKEEFLRAIQRVHLHHAQEPALIFRWALNLKENAIQHDIQAAARKFVRRMSR
jgi:hypothetical protein